MGEAAEAGHHLAMADRVVEHAVEGWLLPFTGQCREQRDGALLLDGRFGMLEGQVGKAARPGFEVLVATRCDQRGSER